MDKDLQRAPEQRREPTSDSDPAWALVNHIHRNFNIYRSVPHKRMDTCGPDCVPYAPGQTCCIPR